MTRFPCSIEMHSSHQISVQSLCVHESTPREDLAINRENRVKRNHFHGHKHFSPSKDHFKEIKRKRDEWTIVTAVAEKCKADSTHQMSEIVCECTRERAGHRKQLEIDRNRFFFFTSITISASSGMTSIVI